MPSHTPRPARSLRIVTAASALTLLALFTGCGSSEKQEEEKQIPEVQRRYDDIYLLRSGGVRTDKHMGYLVEEIAQTPQGEVVSYVVCDTSFKRLGFYLADGSTYRYREQDITAYDLVGRFQVGQSLEQLFGKPGQYDIRPSKFDRAEPSRSEPPAGS